MVSPLSAESSQPLFNHKAKLIMEHLPKIKGIKPLTFDKQRFDFKKNLKDVMLYSGSF